MGKKGRLVAWDTDSIHMNLKVEMISVDSILF